MVAIFAPSEEFVHWLFTILNNLLFYRNWQQFLFPAKKFFIASVWKQTIPLRGIEQCVHLENRVEGPQLLCCTLSPADERPLTILPIAHKTKTALKLTFLSNGANIPMGAQSRFSQLQGPIHAFLALGQHEGAVSETGFHTNILLVQA